MQVESLPTFNQPISWLKEQDEAAPRERENSQQPQQLQQQNVVSDGDCDMLKPIADSTQATTPCSRVLYANFQPASQPVVQSHNNQFPPPALVGEKYLIFEQVDSSTLCRCINVHTHEEVICKVVGGREADSMLAAHYRLDGHLRVNKLQEVLLGSKFLYLVFPRSYGDLHSHVRTHKRLCEREARHFFLQIADTVKACHENGIVLRDLKLRKFVFADAAKTQLKLETLEDAVILENPDDDLLQDKRGCPAYVSPEILRSHAQYSGRAADMWSLGVILYTMLVGRYPFNDNEHVSLFAKISRGHFIIPEHLSPKARCLIRSLLRREPSERMTAEDVLLHPWLSQEEDDDYSSRFDQLVPVFRA